MSEPLVEPTHIVIPGGRLPDQIPVAPRQDLHLTLVQIAEPDQTGLGVWQLRDGAEVHGHLLGTPEAVEEIRSALRALGPFSPEVRGADDLSPSEHSASEGEEDTFPARVEPVS